MQPRLSRLREAANYLSIDRDCFNAEISPTLIEIPIRKQGIAFDKLNIDTCVEYYKQCTGRPVSRKKRQL
jgi:hypothetical protein